MKKLLILLVVMVSVGCAPTPSKDEVNQPYADVDGTIGVVVMHGKGGTPNSKIRGLVSTLKKSGFHAVAPEMPWSGYRGVPKYRASVDDAYGEIAGYISQLRKEGAEHVFLAGHSLGANMALSYATHEGQVDGVIGIAPGHIVGGRFHQRSTEESVLAAQTMIGQGSGKEVTDFKDYNIGRKFEVQTTPLIYQSYFDPEGKANFFTNIAALKEIPILWIAPDKDKVTVMGLAKRIYMQASDHPLNRYQLIRSDHGSAPAKSASLVMRWMEEVVGKR